MLVLTIIYDEKEDIMDELCKVKSLFEDKNIFLKFSESMDSGLHFIKIFCDDSTFNNKYRNKFYLYIANILYKIVIREFYNEEIYPYLTDTCFFLKYDEMDEIAKKSMEILNNEEKITDEDKVYCMNKKNSIMDKIKECIEENDTINVKGFITFRIRDLRDDLESIINKVVEGYMAEKEYNEFIKLLKYFVEVQESKIDKINITIKKDGNYVIQDEMGKDMMDQMMKDLTENLNDSNVGIDDLIISGLITYCPKSIVIHCEENCMNKEIINTIKSVFEDRVSFCNGCEMCKIIKNRIKI